MTSNTTTDYGWINASTTHPLAWCHDLQGSDFIYTPTLYSSATRHIIAAAFILLIIITVVGNGIVIITVVADKPLRKITRALVVSMAASDILVAMCGELQSVVTMLTTDAWVLSDTLCEVFTSADLYFSLSGILHIVCLAGDRYLAICYPFRYERMDRKYLIVSIACAWTVPIAFSFVPIMAEWHRKGLENVYRCLGDLEVHVCTMIPNKGFSTVSFIVMFLLPSLVMGFCYAQIYLTAMSHKERISTMTLGSYSSDKVFQTDQRSVSGKSETTCLQVDAGGTLDDTSRDSNHSQFANAKTPSTDLEPLVSKSKPDECLNQKIVLCQPSNGVLPKIDNRPSHSASCPDISVSHRGSRVTGGNHWLSLSHFFNLESDALFTYRASVYRAARFPKTMKKYSIDGPSNRKVAFSLDSPCRSLDMNNSDLAPGDFSMDKLSSLDDNNTIAPKAQPGILEESSASSEPDAEVSFIPWRRSVAEEGEVPPHLASKNSKLLARIVKRRLKKKQHDMRSHRHGFMGEDFRTARSISIIIVCFAVTWCPYWVTMLVMPYVGPGTVPDPIIGACLWLAYFGSALNPFVYYFSNTSVKKGIKRRILRLTRAHPAHFSLNRY